jgi:hypothetical protein
MQDRHDEYKYREWEGSIAKRSWPPSGHIAAILIGAVERITKLIHCHSRDSHRVNPEYKADVLPLEPTCPANLWV